MKYNGHFIKKIFFSLVAVTFLLSCSSVKKDENQPKNAEIPKEIPKAEDNTSEAEWITDYQKALDISREKNKIILADFTGSDWCGWCFKLEAEVFSKDVFKEWAAKKAVLLTLDFPRSKFQSDILKKQNQKLLEKYNVRGFPTILFLDSEGKVLGKSGYLGGSAEDWIMDAEKKIK